MDAYYNDFQRTFLAKNPCDCNQIRSNQIAASINALNHFINRKDIKDHISRIMAEIPAGTLLRCVKDVSLIYVPVETFLQRVKMVSLTYVPFGTSLRRLRLVGFIYVPVRHGDDVTAWSWTLILVKMD